MSTLTKEWLHQTIADLEEERDATPGAVNVDATMALAAMKLALASLEAEPVAYIFKHPAGRLFWSLTDESNKGQSDVMPVYTASPAPVSVPDDVSGPLAHAYKELTPTFMRNHIDVFERYGIYPEGSAGIQAMRIALDSMNRRAAMLQGAEPVSNRDELPDGWVACSERMPEDEQEVITHNIFGYRHVSFFDEHSGNFFNRLDGSSVDCVEHVLVSHWMPLPAAPQQEVK
ncbi:DUF551 domain-containing protein [Enterobacter hormaechei]|uniref:DUF551 domain-containing protein n=1 Tax=Enterobacter hormaechei subsp. hoffmannii TaxID=1812934 RepID=A0A9Q2WD47_9ENTR|nr:DUF551 domain-containing protein [Enterobacter hormaechei]MBT1778707.1 DUF551 domain-containing protein [Enterobacter hormaechei subsp. hoffmannii]HBM2732858.1 DUF551 domain-containing protein [Enterobacter hormaechei subsp. xiangfangensis]ELE6461999.1 DUF551 domain-containing protein [Enterobacter hormaechei]MBT1854036.1 DUF551 domain-containing protein [Enterobacter hormaechei subsp. hoffmannii]MCE1268422.1 DUF551 domain-containing protein [Enterobacter hormaechei]